MALAGIPPWLAINPQDYINAAKAGSAIGIEIAQAQNRADEAAVARAARQWEFEQSLRQKSLELEAERERAANTLAATERYRLAQAGLESQRLGETQRYHDLQASIGQEANRIRAAAAKGDSEKVHFGQNGEVLLSKRDPETGQWTVSELRGGSFPIQLVTPNTAKSLLESPFSATLDRRYGPGTKDSLTRIFNMGLAASEGKPVSRVPISSPPSPAAAPAPTGPLPPTAAQAGAMLKQPTVYFGSAAGEPQIPANPAVPAPAPAVSAAPTAKPLGPNEVRRKVGNRIIIYDATTKKPLREE